jgi:hypothetical protein
MKNVHKQRIASMHIWFNSIHHRCFCSALSLSLFPVLSLMIPQSINQSTPPTSSTSYDVAAAAGDNELAVIVGAVIGSIVGVVVLVAVAIGIFYLVRRWRIKRGPPSLGPVVFESAEPIDESFRDAPLKRPQETPVHTSSARNMRATIIKAPLTRSTREEEHYIEFTKPRTPADDVHHDEDGYLTFLSRRTLDDIVVPFQELRLGRTLGEGNFGMVQQATFRNMTVAVKVLKQEFESAQAPLKKEAEVMAAIPLHPNVVTLLAFCASPVCLVFEYVDGMNLKE